MKRIRVAKEKSMLMVNQQSRAISTGIFGGACILHGTAFPLVLSFVLEPRQPAWINAQTFIEHYHIIQGVPIYFGFLLVGGSMLLIASIYKLSENDIFAFVGLIFTLVGATIVFVNYIIQITYIPSLVANDADGNDLLISMFTMANRHALAWVLEMWGYGFIGIGTWFCASFFHGGRLEKTVKVLFIGNGALSLLGAFWTTANLGWVLTTPGLVSFVAWNLLYMALAACTIAVLRKRKHSAVSVLPRA